MKVRKFHFDDWKVFKEVGWSRDFSGVGGSVSAVPFSLQK